jgi:thymidylate synthase (FAD)
LGSYSQESQRYCNYQKKGGKIIKDAGRLGIDALNYMRKSFQMYDRLVVEGAKPEEARAVLPNCAATDIVVTYNLRQWRYVLKHRLENTRAQHDMRYLMNLVLDEIKKYEGLKVFFQDIKGL